MPSNPFDPELTEIRRASKAIYDEDWIKSFLRRAPAGVLATALEDQPFLSPKLFVFDKKKHAIFFHSADKGRVWTNIQQNPRVCFSAYEMGRITPAQNACSFGLEYSSVVVFGSIKIELDQQEVVSVLGMFMEKYAPHLAPNQSYTPAGVGDLSGLVIYRLEIEGWSGKQDQRKADLPGAYRYEDVAKGASDL